MNIVFSVIAKIILLCFYCDAAKFLLLSPLGTKSHLIGYKGMLSQLIEKGHELTIVSAFPSSEKRSNVRDIVIPYNYSAASLVTNVFSNRGGNLINSLLLETPEMCSKSLELDIVQSLKKEKFDLVFLSAITSAPLSDCYLSLVYHFKAPLIYMSPTAFIGFLGETVGRPYFISIQGNLLMEGLPPFGFLYRLRATMMNIGFNGLIKYYTLAKMEQICRDKGLCPPDMPSFADIRANSSLAIANSVKMLHLSPTPEMPHLIYGGGSHCKPSNPLPKELEQWVQESGEAGFIYFSLGSAVNTSYMPEEIRNTFINVFGKLKQRVLLKWNTEIVNLPSNIKTGKWFPQQDILGHSKLKLFISHGGLHSIMETTYHGAKLLGVPIYADQFNNINEGVLAGWAESVHLEDITEEKLYAKITDVVNNNKMANVVAGRAKIMKDVPRSPIDEVTYWVEYVLRHNGAPHLRSPVHHMRLYVLYNIDVWLTIFATCICVLVAIFWTLRSIIRCLFSKPKRSNKKKKKQ